jgi:DNA polymerase-1
VYPEQIVDYLALVGDVSDNIPGVPKVGAKTAAKWLNQYGSVDEIIRNADQIAGKVGESLREHIDDLKLSRELATIKMDVELPKKPDQLERGPPDTERLREIYREYELKSLLKQLEDVADATPPGAEARAAPPRARGNYETVLTREAFDGWLKKIGEASLIAFDTETTSLDYMHAEIVGLSFAVQSGEAAYVPVAHDYAGAPEQLPRDDVLAALRAFLEAPDRKKVGHHLKYDAHVLARYGIRMQGMAYDSMLESYVLNSVATRHDMDSSAAFYLGVESIH